MARLGGEIAIAPGEIALDIETLDLLAHQLHRLIPIRSSSRTPAPIQLELAGIRMPRISWPPLRPDAPQPMRLASSSTTL